VQDHDALVHDRDIVAAIAARDATGVATAFDRYAPGLYAYCLSRLGEPAVAADAVQDTFIVASAKVSELSQPDRLRVWLFAVARNECHRRLQTAIRSAPLYEAAEAMDDTGQLSAITEHAELRALVRTALAELDPVERELTELSLRHGLLGTDLAAVLGVPRGEAQVLASRARGRFERSLDVLMVARSERNYCSDLAGILDGRSRKPTVLLRRRVRRHIERCAACSERKRRDLSAAMLLSMLTVPVLPADLRERIPGLVAGASADTASHRAQVLDRVQPFDADGFPVQLTTPSMPHRRGTSLIAATVAAAALVLLGGGMYYVDYSSTHSGPPPAAATKTSAPGSTGASSRPAQTPDHPPSAAPAAVPAPTPSEGPTTPAATPFIPPYSVSPSYSASPSPSRSPSPTRSPSRSPSPTRSPSRSPSPTPTHSPSKTPSTGTGVST
jgi:RNA polymerase sigma factor (sigma-70 family)